MKKPQNYSWSPQEQNNGPFVMNFDRIDEDLFGHEAQLSRVYEKNGKYIVNFRLENRKIERIYLNKQNLSQSLKEIIKQWWYLPCEMDEEGTISLAWYLKDIMSESDWLELIDNKYIWYELNADWHAATVSWISSNGDIILFIPWAWFRTIKKVHFKDADSIVVWADISLAIRNKELKKTKHIVHMIDDWGALISAYRLKSSETPSLAQKNQLLRKEQSLREVYDEPLDGFDDYLKMKNWSHDKSILHVISGFDPSPDVSEYISNFNPNSHTWESYKFGPSDVGSLDTLQVEEANIGVKILSQFGTPWVIVAPEKIKRDAKGKAILKDDGTPEKVSLTMKEWYVYVRYIWKDEHGNKRNSFMATKVKNLKKYVSTESQENNIADVDQAAVA